MDLTLSPDQRDLQAGLRDYLRKVWTPDRLRAAADDPAIDPAEWRELADMGVFRILQPEDSGGMGLGLADAVILFEELGRALVPGPLVATLLAACLPLPGDPIADGTVVTSVDSGDPVALAEHAGSADHLVLVDDAGLSIAPMTDVEAGPVAVPLDPLTPVAAVQAPSAEKAGTAADAEAWRTRGAVLTAALQVGVGQGALDLAVRYATEREQFGRPIGSFQAIKHLLAEALVKVDLARAAVLVAALRLDDPDSGPAGEAVSAAKMLADDAGVGSGRTGVQVHGGMGFTWEVLAHLYLKRAWALETGYGTAGEHALRLAAAY